MSCNDKIYIIIIMCIMKLYVMNVIGWIDTLKSCTLLTSHDSVYHIICWVNTYYLHISLAKYIVQTSTSVLLASIYWPFRYQYTLILPCFYEKIWYYASNLNHYKLSNRTASIVYIIWINLAATVALVATPPEHLLLQGWPKNPSMPQLQYPHWYST